MRLPYETTEQPDAIQKIFCEPFSKLKQHEMSKETAEMLLKIMSLPKNWSGIPQAEKPPLMQIIEKRVEHCFTFKIEEHRVSLFLAYITNSPGTAIMYLTFLQFYCSEHRKKSLNLQDFCEIFGWGFPCEEDLHKLWDAQKVSKHPDKGGSDNLLDYQSAMISIQIPATGRKIRRVKNGNEI